MRSGPLSRQSGTRRRCWTRTCRIASFCRRMRRGCPQQRRGRGADLAALDILMAERGGQAQGDSQTVEDLAAQAKAATFVEYGTPEPLAVGAGVLDKFVADALAAL